LVLFPKKNIFLSSGVCAFSENDIPTPGDPAARPAGHLLSLACFVGLCLLVSVAEAAVTVPAVRGWYLSLTMPAGTPPNWLFGPVWTFLYISIGVSAWCIWRRRRIGHRAALRLWGWQLLVNAAWSPAFFGLHSPALALGVILPTLVLIGLTVRRFWRLDRVAAALMLPYAAWMCYATYLNCGFVWLNPV
jgi:benzodiazapine receptor